MVKSSGVERVETELTGLQKRQWSRLGGIMGVSSRGRRRQGLLGLSAGYTGYKMVDLLPFLLRIELLFPCDNNI